MDPSSQARSSVRRHDNAIDALLLRKIEDRLRGSSHLYDDSSADAAPLGTGADIFQVLERMSLAALDLLVIETDVADSTDDVVDRRYDVQQDHLGVEKFRQRERFRQRNFPER